METLDIKDVKLHKITETHPIMTLENYAAFKSSMKKNGQLVPVLVYRGRIVDGRHRLKALKELGATTINAEILKHSLTLKEVEAMVNGSEDRRHQTPTQLAIKGYNLYKNGATQPEACEAAGCKLTNLKRVVKLSKLGREDIITTLAAGGSFNVSTDSKFAKPTDSLAAIVRYVEVEQQLQKEFEIDNYENSLTDTAVIKDKLTDVEQVQVDGIGILIKTLSEQALDILIAKAYKAKEATNGQSAT